MRLCRMWVQLLSSLINAAIRAVKVELEVREQQDLEERLAELEAAYEQRS